MFVYNTLSVFQRTLLIYCSWLSKQKKLYADTRAIQQIEFYRMLKTNSHVCTILEKSKETTLEFYKGTPKALWEYISGWLR